MHSSYFKSMLLQTPGSTLITVLSLALGIGVNTAVYTAYKAFVLRPVDARNASEIFNIALARDSGLQSTPSAIQTLRVTGIRSARSVEWRHSGPRV